MDAQKIQSYFSKPDKIILGVGAEVSKKINSSPLVPRIGLVVLTFFFIPLGLFLYILLYLTLVLRKGKTVTFSLTGALLGIPLSYYFQPEIIKNWKGGTGIFGYLTGLPGILEEYNQYVGNSWSLVGNLVLSILLFTFLGGIIGYILEKKTNQSS